MILEAFKNHPVVHGFTPEDFESLSGGIERKEYEAEAKVIEEGMSLDALIFLEHGVVEVQKQTDHGRPHTITTLSARTVLGELEFLSGSRASASVMAKTVSTAHILPRNAFDRWLDGSNPCAGRLAANLARILARRLEETNLALVRLVKPESVREFEAFRHKLVTEWDF